MSDLPKVRKARLERSQKESDKFHAMMGYCIAAWADADEFLFKIFRHCVGGAPLQCAIIYYKTPSLETRFTLTDEIVRSVLPKKKSGEHDHPHVKRWNKIFNKREELLAMRRRIAHHPVAVRMNIVITAVGPPPRDGTPREGKVDQFSSLELYMSEAEKMRGREAHLPPLQFKDLEHHFDAVGEFANDLLGFLMEVILKPPAEPSQPNPKPHRAKNHG